MHTPMCRMRITRIATERGALRPAQKGYGPMRRRAASTKGLIADGGNGDTLLTLISHST